MMSITAFTSAFGACASPVRDRASHIEGRREDFAVVRADKSTNRLSSSCFNFWSDVPTSPTFSVTLKKAPTALRCP